MADESYCPECLTDYGDNLGMVVCDACRAEANARGLIATLTRERDEARAALALAYPRALQAAAAEVQALLDDENETDGLDMEAILLTANDRILALTPEDIERLAAEATE